MALRLQALRWERDYVGELIEREEVYPIVGYQSSQSRLSHIEKLLKHNAGRWTAAERPTCGCARFCARCSMASCAGLPGVSMPERSAGHARDVQVKAAEHVMGKLQQAIADSDVPTEDASALLLEYQRTCMALRNANPSITAIARANDKVEDVRRLGLRLELEQIQTMYEEERLCRDTCEAPARERLPHAGGSGRQRVGRRAGGRHAGVGSAQTVACRTDARSQAEIGRARFRTSLHHRPTNRGLAFECVLPTSDALHKPRRAALPHARP